MKNLIILLMLFAIGCPSLFGQEMPYSSRIDKIFYRYPHDVYAMKYPLRILEGRIFDYHTDTFPDYLANDSKEMPKDSQPFGFTSDEEYVCYFKTFANDSAWSQIILRSAKDGTVLLVYPPASSPPLRAMVPKIPIFNSRKNLVAMLANNNGQYRSSLASRGPTMTIIAPRFLHYLLIVDIESGKTLHAIPTLDCYNSKAATWAFESKERNVTPRWPHEDLALFMPNDSGILVRQSAFQIDIYDFESERTIQSFNVLKTHGVKNMISTFAFTDDGYLRTFLWPSSPLLSAHSDLRLFEDITDIPEYIDWDIRTGKIVREGPLTKGSDGSWGMDNVSAKLLETFEEILGKSALYNPNLQLMWSFYVGGDTKHRNAGISHSCLYVTYDDPAATLYHTVVHTGCVAANGVTPATSGNVDQPIFDAIWNKIKGLENYSVTIANGAVVNNELLYYYGRGVNDASTLKKLPVECVVSGNQAPYTITQATGISAPTIARQKEIIATKELLQYFDGKCEAWAVFLIDVLAVQGISSTKKEIYLPNNSQNDPNAFKVNTTTLGQGKANPRPGEVVWGNHYVVEYVGKIYDPSYGEEYGNSNVALANFAQKCVSMGDSYPNISQIFLPHPPMCYR